MEEHYEPNENKDDLEIPQLASGPKEYGFQKIVTDSALEERCSSDQIKELAEVLWERRDVFSNNPGKIELIEHDIELTSEHP